MDLYLAGVIVNVVIIVLQLLMVWKTDGKDPILFATLFWSIMGFVVLLTKA